ncbi:MAG: hypothetical protein B6V02_03645 [Thermoprotei archaeon ex4572_64]|nr:MAG: hypothetical protein B6V02_03645 [Thermoprotei archaeon ex4572_64]
MQYGGEFREEYKEVSAKVPTELYRKMKNYKSRFGLKTWRDFFEHCVDSLENKAVVSEEIIQEIRNLKILIIQLIDKVSKIELTLKNITEHRK